MIWLTSVFLLEEVDEVRKHIMAFAPTIRGVHRLRTRKAGSSRFVEFHIRVAASMSVDESHRIADMITCTIKQHYPEPQSLFILSPATAPSPRKARAAAYYLRKIRRQ